MNTRFKAVMDYEGYPKYYGWKWKHVEALISKMYVMAYNAYATGFEFGPVNEEFDRLHPDITQMDEGSPEWILYNKFVAQKATAWVDEHINNTLMANLTMRFFVSEDEVVFTGYDILHPECKVSMHLVPFE